MHFSYLSSQIGDELERVTLGTERSLAARDDERQWVCGRKREDALEKQKSNQQDYSRGITASEDDA